MVAPEENFRNPLDGVLAKCYRLQIRLNFILRRKAIAIMPSNAGQTGFSQNEFATAVKRAAMSVQPMGLSSAVGATPDAQLQGLIEGGFCGLYERVRLDIKSALSKTWVGAIAFHVLESLIISRYCPQSGQSAETRQKAG